MFPVCQSAHLLLECSRGGKGRGNWSTVYLSACWLIGFHACGFWNITKTNIALCKCIKRKIISALTDYRVDYTGTLYKHTLSRLYSCQSSFGQKAPCDSRSLVDSSKTQSWAWTGNEKGSWQFILNNLSVIMQNVCSKIQYGFLPASFVCSHKITSHILFQ